MENVNTVKAATIGIGGMVSAVAAWLFARLGILLYVLLILAVAMAIDYLTGMLASKTEAIDHPDDPSYGWNSKKGAKGIIKKVGYLCIIAVAMMVDWVILHVAADIGFEIALKAFLESWSPYGICSTKHCRSLKMQAGWEPMYQTGSRNT